MPKPTSRLRALERENAELRRAVDELKMLNELAAAIGGAEGVQEVMQVILRRALHAVDAEQGVVTLLEDGSADPMRTLVRTRGRSPNRETLRPGERLMGWMLFHKKPLLVNDPRGDARFRDAAWDRTVRSLLGVPMMADGRVIGVLTAYNKRDGRGFRPEDGRLLSIIAGQSAQVVERARLHEERERVLRVFGQHTAPAVVDELLRHGAAVPSRRQDVCVMFVDVRDYARVAEREPPEAIVAYLNALFGCLIDAVNRHHGVVHQLLGDGFMALFGAPLSHGNDRCHAVEAALEMIARVDAASAQGTVPPTRIGVGLHAGEVVAGMVGSAVHREYKVTGDVVNVAARIEKLNKRFDAQLLVSEPVWSALDGAFEGEALGNVSVRGRRGSIALYRLA